MYEGAAGLYKKKSGLAMPCRATALALKLSEPFMLEIGDGYKVTRLRAWRNHGLIIFLIALVKFYGCYATYSA